MKLPTLFVFVGLLAYATAILNPKDQEFLNEFFNLNAGVLSTLNGWSTNNTDVCTPWQGLLCTGGVPQRINRIKLNQVGTLHLGPNSLMFPDLGFLDLSFDSISGPLPQNIGIGNPQPMVSLNLNNNQINGSIPSWFSSSLIQTIDFSNNLFTGSIDPNFGTTSMINIDFSFNQLTGTFPANLAANAPNLNSLKLNNNKLSGTLPTNLISLGKLDTLDLGYNQLSGQIPELTATTLNTLNLEGNNFNGLVPQFLKAYTKSFNASGVTWRCPIPSCKDGVPNCVLASIPSSNCYCPCSDLSQCVENVPGCTCPTQKYGTICDKTCPGTIFTNGAVKVCNNHGTCDSGATGTGTCSCFSGYRTTDCNVACPGGAATPCKSLGLCNDLGICQCAGNTGGSDCGSCAVSFGGAACSVQCPGTVTNPDPTQPNIVCSGQGTCNTNAECMCFDGYEGSACESKITNSKNWVGIGLAIGFGVLVLIGAILLAGAVVAWMRTKKQAIEAEQRVDELLEEQDEEVHDQEDTEAVDRLPLRRDQAVDMSMA